MISQLKRALCWLSHFYQLVQKEHITLFHNWASLSNWWHH